MKYRQIPKTTIERLPLYYRCLGKLRKKDIEVVSSRELGDQLGIPSTQVRKDLSYYGEFGRRGVGYEVADLQKHLEKILGLNQTWPMVLVGAGNLGRALVNYEGFKRLGLRFELVFDADLDKIGNRIGDLEVYSIKELNERLEGSNIKIGVIAVPASAAQEVADALVDSGIRALWNFSPARIKVPEKVILRNEDLSVGVVGLVYYLNRS